MIEGICQQKKWRRKVRSGELIPWDTTGSTELREAAHAKARMLCASCPALEACEAYLSDMERAGISVAGVVAGRYSDLALSATPSRKIKKLPEEDAVERQATCRGCGQRMWPQFATPDLIAQTPAPQHCGEGLCENCWPDMRRRSRNRREE